MYLHILNVNTLSIINQGHARTHLKEIMKRKNLLQVMFYFKISFISINENVTYEVYPDKGLTFWCLSKSHGSHR